MRDLQALTKFFYKKASVSKKNEPLVQEVNVGDNNEMPYNLNQLMYHDDQSSMLERTSVWMLPIINEIVSKMIKESEFDTLNGGTSTQKRL